MTSYVVLGASRGIGDAFACALPEAGDHVLAVSRTQPSSLRRDDGVQREWLPCDLADSEQVGRLAIELGARDADRVLYNAGVWERQPFAETSDQELRDIVTVNLTSALVVLKALRLPLTRSTRPHVVIIGSTSGLENEGTVEVAYAATKFAARGVAHSLREVLRADRVPVTCLNIGSTATDLTWDDGTDAALQRYDGTRMPVSDVVQMVRAVFALSRAACPKEIHMPALTDTDA